MQYLYVLTVINTVMGSEEDTGGNLSMITFLTTAFLNELSLTSHTYFQFEPYLVRWRGTQIDLQRHVLGEYWGNISV